MKERWKANKWKHWILKRLKYRIIRALKVYTFSYWLHCRHPWHCLVFNAMKRKWDKETCSCGKNSNGIQLKQIFCNLQRSTPLEIQQMHGQGERIKQPLVTIQTTDPHIECSSHVCNFYFEYVIGYVNARLSTVVKQAWKPDFLMQWIMHSHLTVWSFHFVSQVAQKGCLRHGAQKTLWISMTDTWWGTKPARSASYKDTQRSGLWNYYY